MRILYYSPHPNLNFGAPSGPGTHMREMVRAFRELGHEVELLILGGEEWKPVDTAPAGKAFRQRVKPIIPGILWHTLKDRQLVRFDQHAKQELTRCCDRFKPDLIYERGYYLMLSGVRVATGKNIPHILEMNAPYPEEKVEMEGKSMLHRRALAAERKQALLTNRLVVVSSDLKEYYRRRVPACAERTVVTPNAIRDPDNLPDTGAGLRIRQKYGIPQDALVVGFVGSIFPYHGVDTLISAFADLKDHRQHLLIVGGGEILDDLKKQSRESGLEGRVTFTDNIPHQEVAAHIAAMDITVMARSNWYGSPVKIFEYGMQAKPVIAPDVGPVRDVMTHMVNGVLVGEADASLELALRTLVSDADLRNRLGEAFRDQIRSRHTWKKMAERVLEGFSPGNSR